MQSEDSAAAGQSQRRSYGTGSLYVRTDRSGRDTWYGYWRTNGRAVKRRIGLRRAAGSREGLTRAQAEAELRRLIGEVKVEAIVGERLTVEQVGQRYLHYLQSKGRKPSTIAAVRGHLTHWHSPFFAERSLQAITAEDIADLISLMHAGERRAESLAPSSCRRRRSARSSARSTRCLTSQRSAGGRRVTPWTRSSCLKSRAAKTSVSSRRPKCAQSSRPQFQGSRGDRPCAVHHGRDDRPASG